MNTFSKSEKNEFFQLYKKDKRAVDIFLKVAIALVCIYFTICTVQSLLDRDFLNAAMIVLFGVIIVFAINAFRTRLLFRPLREINKNRYCVYLECVIDKKISEVATHSNYESRFKICGNKITYYYVSSVSHRNAEAINAENWNSIQIGDTVCFVEIGKIIYAFKPSEKG